MWTARIGNLQDSFASKYENFRYSRRLLGFCEQKWTKSDSTRQKQAVQCGRDITCFLVLYYETNNSNVYDKNHQISQKYVYEASLPLIVVNWMSVTFQIVCGAAQQVYNFFISILRFN